MTSSRPLDRSQPGKSFAPSSTIRWNVFPPPDARPPRKTKKKTPKQNRNRAGTNTEESSNGKQQQQQQQQQQQHQQQETEPATQDRMSNQRSEQDPPGKEFWRQKQQQFSYTYPYQVGDPVLMLVSHHRYRYHDADVNAEQPRNKKPKPSQSSESNEPTGGNVNNNVSGQSCAAEHSATTTELDDSHGGGDGGGGGGDGDAEKDKHQPTDGSNHHKTNYLVPVPGRVVRVTEEQKHDANGSDNGNGNGSGETSERFVHVQLEPTPNSIRNRGNDGSHHSGTIRMLSPKEQRKLLQPRFGASRLRPTATPPPLPPTDTSHKHHHHHHHRGPVVLFVEETLPFRQVVRFQLHSHASATDRVLEIGCSTGELSRIIWNNRYYSSALDHQRQEGEGDDGPSPNWIGMDHSQEMIDKCADKLRAHPLGGSSNSNSTNNNNNNHHHTYYTYTTKLVKVDALAEPQRAVREVGKLPPTVVLIDIGGNRECGPVLKTLSWVLESFGGETHRASTSTSTNTNTNTNQGGEAIVENADQGGSNRNRNFNNDNTLRLVIVKSRALVRQLISDCTDANHNSNYPSSWDEKKPTTEASFCLDASTGFLTKGSEWFASALRRLSDPSATNSGCGSRSRGGGGGGGTLFKHPLKAPLVLSPVDEKTPICRYHNYHKDGCRLHSDSTGNVAAGDEALVVNNNNNNNKCPLDHDHCHACRKRGHVAKHCPRIETLSCY